LVHVITYHTSWIGEEMVGTLIVEMFVGKAYNIIWLIPINSLSE